MPSAHVVSSNRTTAPSNDAARKYAIEADNATDIGSARSDTKDAGGMDVADAGVEQGVRTPARMMRCVASLAPSCAVSQSACVDGRVVAGRRSAFSPAQEEASLAGMLTKMNRRDQVDHPQPGSRWRVDGRDASARAAVVWYEHDDGG